MSGLFDRLFGRKVIVFRKKSVVRTSKEEFEKFKSEGSLDDTADFSMHVASRYEQSSGMSALTKGENTVEPGQSTNKPYDPDRLKREAFIGNVTKDIVDLDDALTKNELFISQSREQLKRFKAFAHSAEIDVDVMYRLRTENGSLLSDRNRVQKKNDRLQQDLETEKAKSSAALNRTDEIREALETAREEILVLIERDTDYRGKIEEYSTIAVQRENELVQLNRTVERIEVENQSLYGQCERFVSDLDIKFRESTELDKSLKEKTAKLNAEQVLNEKLSGENKSFSQQTDTLQAENVELLSRLQSAQLEAKEIEKRASGTNRITEEELYSLRARVERLQSQLRVKSQVSRDLEEQSKTAHAEAKVSKEASRDLHKRLVEALTHREQDQEQVGRLNSEIGDQNKRFDKLLVELEQLRDENTKLRRSLKIQKQLWGGMIDDTVLFKEGTSEKSDMEDTPPPPGTKTH